MLDREGSVDLTREYLSNDAHKRRRIVFSDTSKRISTATLPLGI